MKKFIAIIACAAAVLTASAQNQAAPKLDSFTDSLSYLTGQTEGSYTKSDALRFDSQQQAQNYIDANRRAIELAFSIPDSDGEYLKALERAISMRSVFADMARKGLDVSPELFLKGYTDGMAAAARPMNEVAAEANTVKQLMNRASVEAKNIAAARKKAEYDENAAAGAAFVAAAKKADKKIKTTESGLSYKVLKAGKNKKATHPTDSDKVKVHYTGKLIDGTVFDSSVERGKPEVFDAGRLIKGFTEGLELMTPGSKYIFYIPAELGYGERGGGDKIGPGATLIFEVELLDINPTDESKTE